MNVKECFEKGWLKRILIEKARVESALALAKHYLERSEGNLKIEYFDVSFLMSYNALLQATRALLFSEGVKERSHACAVAFLHEKYGTETTLSPFVELLDTYRQIRHQAQYEGEFVSEKEAKDALEDAKRFLSLVKKKLS